jgi:hypothetical protein
MNVTHNENRFDFDAQIYDPFGPNGTFSKKIAAGIPIKPKDIHNPIVISV